VRILTRYILGEILSLTLIGCALFTFILFMPQLPHILEVVVRNSSTLTDVAQVFLFTLPNLFKVTIPMAVLWGILLGLSRLASDSEIIAMRASGLGIGYFVRVASIVAIGGTLLGLGNSLYLAPRANQAILRDSAEDFLRGLSQLRSLCAGRALRGGRGQLAASVHGRRFQPRESADYDGSLRDGSNG
jgi:lipopolysaccharide export LptBFGC system permease protein LptF